MGNEFERVLSYQLKADELNIAILKTRLYKEILERRKPSILGFNYLYVVNDDYKEEFAELPIHTSDELTDIMIVFLKSELVRFNKGLEDLSSN